MTQSELLTKILSGEAPQNIRTAVARGLAPLPPNDSLQALVFLASDKEPEIAASARKTLSGLDEEEILSQLKAGDCTPLVLEYFGVSSNSDRVLQAIITNPSTSGKLIESISLTLSPQLLTVILDNRMRILEFPGILENIKLNPFATQDIKRLVQEIETEFFGAKRTEYSVEQIGVENTAAEEQPPAFSSMPDLEIEIPLEDLSLEGLPQDEQTKEVLIAQQVSNLPVRDKIRYALFGTREIRAMLVRDTNKEISRMVLRSPKLTEAEVESISSMRGVAEDILRDIGNSREFTKSYNVVHNLIKNPKTPPIISQRLLFRLRTQDLTLLTRDRSIPDAIRFHATRTLNQRTKKGPS